MPVLSIVYSTVLTIMSLSIFSASALVGASAADKPTCIEYKAS